MIDIKDCDNAIGLCNEFIELIRKKFSNVNIEFSVNSYTDDELDSRVYILSDQDDEILRVNFKDGRLHLFSSITRETFTKIYNLDRQFERFWIALYDKYKISKKAIR
jgi:hypothetical protein